MKKVCFILVAFLTTSYCFSSDKQPARCELDIYARMMHLRIESFREAVNTNDTKMVTFFLTPDLKGWITIFAEDPKTPLEIRKILNNYLNKSF